MEDICQGHKDEKAVSYCNTCKEIVCEKCKKMHEGHKPQEINEYIKSLPEWKELEEDVKVENFIKSLKKEKGSSSLLEFCKIADEVFDTWKKYGEYRNHQNIEHVRFGKRKEGYFSSYHESKG